MPDVYESDRSNMWEKIWRFPEMCEEALSYSSGMRPFRPSGVVIAGMGGSAIPGDILRDWLDPPFPLEVCRGYHPPGWISPNCLVIAISYSGETEETLSCVRGARERGARLAGVGSGGTLQEELRDCPFIRVPSGLPSRAAFPYLFFSTVRILEEAGIIEKREEIGEALGVLRSSREKLSEESRKLAGRLLGRLPFIYTPPRFYSVGLRMKTQLNENSKIPAKVEAFPELCHNEIVGLRGTPQNVAFLLVRDRLEEERITIRVDFLKGLLRGKEMAEIWGEGKGLLARMLSVLYFGDFLSYHLAGLRGVDPSPVEEISELKKELQRHPH